MWTPQALRDLVREKLEGAPLVLVSNREPYIHTRSNGSIQWIQPGWRRYVRARPHSASLRGHLDCSRQR